MKEKDTEFIRALMGLFEDTFVRSEILRGFTEFVESNTFATQAAKVILSYVNRDIQTGKVQETDRDTAIRANFFTAYANNYFLFTRVRLDKKLVYAMIESGITCSADFITQDEYVKNIKFDKQECGDFVIDNEAYTVGELVALGYETVPETWVQVPKFACFKEPVLYPIIANKNEAGVWMSVTPNEILTMQEPIKRATGKVLTLGLGLGYFAYHVHLKEDVESVTIIEREQAIIDLFETYILPQFKMPEKIHIIKADAVKYLNHLQDGEFDYCFADIWQGNEDSSLAVFMKIVEQGRKLKQTKIEYWIENFMTAPLEPYIRDNLLMKAVSLFDMEDMMPPDIDRSNPMAVRCFRYITKLYKDIKPKKLDDMFEYVKPDFIMSLIKKTHITF